MVDLAGSERVKRSGVAGKELKEAININGSLLTLGNVVAALAAKKKHVPYRDSKLTRVLEGSVGGTAARPYLCCASPAADSTSETLSALSFAQRAMRCECKAVVNVAEVGDFPALSVWSRSSQTRKPTSGKRHWLPPRENDRGSHQGEGGGLAESQETGRSGGGRASGRQEAARGGSEAPEGEPEAVDGYEEVD